MKKKKIALIAVAVLLVAAIVGVVMFAMDNAEGSVYVGYDKDGGIKVQVDGKTVKTFEPCDHMVFGFVDGQEIAQIFTGSDAGMVEYQVDYQGNVVSEKQYESVAEFSQAAYAVQWKDVAKTVEVVYDGKTVATFDGYNGSYGVWCDDNEKPEYIVVYLTDGTDYLVKKLNLDGTLISEESFESAEAFYEAAYEVLGIY